MSKDPAHAQNFAADDQASVSLRALEPEDLEFLFALENDPDLWAVSDVLPAPISRHALREYLRHSAASLAEAGQMRLIISNEKKQAVGTLDLYEYSALHQRAGVGIAVLQSERRRGYAQAALQKLLPYAREALRLHQLYCTIAVDNEASIRLFERVGFRWVGLRQQWLRNTTGTGWVDAAEMQLLLRK
ncbi:GNAT family N-acetyltransferase [Hymenobacter sp. BT559]|jgi:diamine N-acetyltransferase|uniref:GNAT family N-acetyltransferase n=1 Tax=Hymenobacter sp. BT559 TaxID=2795729 RepID=UPI0018ECF4E5|nr:GNAT family N-acetyltransferase [Hymenobacter sp. BT559]MBJ6145242.1 GNAT family N-acetyltransferase [Hymenobacter sp. BT559]